MLTAPYSWLVDHSVFWRALMFIIDWLTNRIDGSSSCHGKVPYLEKSASQAAIDMAAKKREPFEAYKCRHCPLWHIGHPRFWKWTREQRSAAGVE